MFRSKSIETVRLTDLRDAHGDDDDESNDQLRSGTLEGPTTVMLGEDEPLCKDRMKLSRMEEKTAELLEMTKLSDSFSASYETLRSQRSMDSMTRIKMRECIRKMEVTAIIIENLRGQIHCLEKFAKMSAKKNSGQSSNLEEIMREEREISRLEGEIVSGKEVFHRPQIGLEQSQCPPSPILAVKRETIEKQLAGEVRKLVLDEVAHSRPAPVNVLGEGESKFVTFNAKDQKEMREFCVNSLQKHKVCKLVLKRKRGIISTEFSLYDEHEREIVMTAVKKASLGSHYVIKTAHGDVIGEVKREAMSDVFKVTTKDHNKSREVAAIYYKIDDSEALKTNDDDFPTRMRVILEAGEKGEKELDLYKEFQEKNYESLIVLSNKRAVYIEGLKTHVLQFSSSKITDAAISSMKNFQLVSRFQVDHVLVEFGKTGDDVYELTFQNPLSPLTALSSALSVF